MKVLPALLLRQRVWSKVLLSASDLEHVKPLLGVSVKQREDFVRREMMPVFAEECLHRGAQRTRGSSWWASCDPRLSSLLKESIRRLSTTISALAASTNLGV